MAAAARNVMSAWSEREGPLRSVLPMVEREGRGRLMVRRKVRGDWWDGGGGRGVRSNWPENWIGRANKKSSNRVRFGLGRVARLCRPSEEVVAHHLDELRHLGPEEAELQFNSVLI